MFGVKKLFACLGTKRRNKRITCFDMFCVFVDTWPQIYHHLMSPEPTEFAWRRGRPSCRLVARSPSARVCSTLDAGRGKVNANPQRKMSRKILHLEMMGTSIFSLFWSTYIIYAKSPLTLSRSSRLVSLVGHTSFFIRRRALTCAILGSHMRSPSESGVPPMHAIAREAQQSPWKEEWPTVLWVWS